MTYKEALKEIARLKAVTIDDVRRIYTDYLGATEGDLVVVFQSGAYGASASPQPFLGHPLCAEVLV